MVFGKKIKAQTVQQETKALDEQEIRELAWRLWDQANQPDGRADEFWFAAEDTLKKEYGLVESDLED